MICDICLLANRKGMYCQCGCKDFYCIKCIEDFEEEELDQAIEGAKKQGHTYMNFVEKI